MHFHGQRLKWGVARALQHSQVTVLERTMAVDLLIKDGKIAGATALNVRTGRFIVCKAKAVVLATGKLARIFNPWHYMSRGKFKMLYHYHAGSGDGMAIALKAGAELINMEVGGIGSGIWGCRLADKLHPSHYPIIPGKIYDGVGRMIKDVDKEGWFDVNELFELEREGRGPCFADVTYLPEEWHKSREEFIKDSFPVHLKFIKERGLDTRRDRFEIAHYRPEFNSAIAGIAYDEDGQTCVDGLYACGDTAGGSTFVGAANAAVFGMRAGKHLAAKVAKMEQVAIEESQVTKQKEMVFGPINVDRGVEPIEVELKIRDIVERYCGPERSEGSINQGLWRLKAVKDRFLPELKAKDNHELMSAQEVRNLFLLSEAYMLSARERKESGMRTFRLDYPDKANAPWKEAVVVRFEEGDLKLGRKGMPGLKKEFKEIAECQST
ncbi:MAG: FAD-binding protein [Deltaproteobacteria bacterium]